MGFNDGDGDVLEWGNERVVLLRTTGREARLLLAPPEKPTLCQTTASDNAFVPLVSCHIVRVRELVTPVESTIARRERGEKPCEEARMGDEHAEEQKAPNSEE